MSAIPLFGWRAAWRSKLVLGGLLFAGVLGACGDSGSHSQGEGLPESVSALIDEKGGTLHASGVTVEIPPGALKGRVKITATKSKEDESTAKTKSKVVSDVYKFGPEGTKFEKDVKVSFPVAVDHSSEKGLDHVSVYFTKEKDPSTYEKLATDKDDKDEVVSAKVRHFSSGFAGIPLDLDAGASPDDAGSTMDAGIPPHDSGIQDAGAAMDAGMVTDAGSQVQYANIVVNTRDVGGTSVNLSWAAYQDGDDPWQPLAVSATTGVYQFRIKGSRYGVAFVCGTKGAASYGTIHYASVTATTLDVTTTAAACATAPAVTVDGVTGTGVLNGTDYYLRFGSPYVDNYTELTNGTYSAWTMAARNLPTDLMFGSATYNYKGLTAYQFVRDFVSSADPSTVNVDLSASPVGPNATVTVSNVEYSLYNIPVEYATKGASMGMSLVNGDVAATVGDAATSYAVAYSTIPESDRVSTDRYIVNLSESGTTIRTNFTSFYNSGDINVALPAHFSATLSVQNAPDAGYTYTPSDAGVDPSVGPRFFPLYTFSAYAGATSYLFGWQYSEYTSENYHGFDITFDPSWLEGAKSESYTFPDLSSVKGFDAQWLPPTGNDLGNGLLEVTAQAVHEDTTAGVYTKTTSEVDYYYPHAPLN